MDAYHSGVNYYDTAYIYGGSEAAIGEIFARNGIRKDIYIATKLPHYLIKSVAGIEKLFQEELRRLRTDYVDYYLMHMLNDADTWQRLLDMGIGRNKLFKFLREKKILQGDNMPYQRFVDAGYFKVVEGKFMAGDNVVISKTTYVKQKGIDYIRKCLTNETVD
jgi:hypothetical protein